MNEIIIVIRGGLVQAVFAQNNNIKVDVLDYDNLITEDDQEVIKELEALEAKTKTMISVY